LRGLRFSSAFENQTNFFNGIAIFVICHAPKALSGTPMLQFLKYFRRKIWRKFGVFDSKASKIFFLHFSQP
jgi:hypothetical protein